MTAFTRRRIGDLARAAYGGVAALLQDDMPGAHVMSADLLAICDDPEEAAWAVAIFTLERLDGSPLDPHEVMSDAEAHAPSTLVVRAAAMRLDALASGDLDGFAMATTGLTDLATDVELIGGALALLTSVVRMSAERAGRQPTDVCRELCTAASLALDDDADHR